MTYVHSEEFDFTVDGTGEACDCSCEDLDRYKLGQSTWYFLHEVVKHGDIKYENAFRNLMYILTVLYPCPECRVHIKEYLEHHKVKMTEEWICDFHNDVNVRLGKEVFNCTV
jgi:FAD-linked sulfhydryl oxidase